MSQKDLERKFGRKWKALAVTLAVMVALLAAMVIKHYAGGA